MNQILIPFQEAISLLKEGDVLLFRGRGFISKIIGAASETPYSHVAIASFLNGVDSIWMCVEFREGSPIAGLFNKNAAGGGRLISLENVVKEYPSQIDVYRPIREFDKIVFNPTTHSTVSIRNQFNGKKVTNVMKKLTGLPYGWRRIWWMIKRKLILFRWFSKQDLIIDDVKDIVYPVCSTAVAYAFNINGYDLIKNRSDEATEPGDIAKSARLNYLFTLQ